MMRWFAWILLCGLSLQAQHIGYLVPAGGQRGRTVELAFGGQQLWGVTNVLISGAGVSVESVQVIPNFPNFSGTQFRYIEGWLRGIHEGHPQRPPLPEEKEQEGWRKHPYFEKLDQLTLCERELFMRWMYLPRNPLQMNPAIQQKGTIRLRIAANAPVGKRELRLVSRNGVSNPLSFWVGTKPEYREDYFPMPPMPADPTEFPLPGVMNGQILPGESDTFLFSAAKGQSITFRVQARVFLPFLGDCVPGYFQPLLEIQNAAGEVVAFADDQPADPDPLLRFTPPASGVYTLTIRDALYRGREDFVYRISAGRESPPRPSSLRPPSFCAAFPIVESVKSPLTQLPVLVRGTLSEKERAIRIPVSLRAEENVVFDLYSQRLGEASDFYLQILDPAGSLLATVDDVTRAKVGIAFRRSADPMIRFQAPRQGRYTVVVSSLTEVSQAMRFLLRIDRPRPRFSVYTTRSFYSVPIGGVVPFPVLVEREEGYQGEISLSLPPESGYVFRGASTIPPGAERVMLTLGTTARRPGCTQALALWDLPTRRAVQPCDEAMQAFAYTHLVPAEQLYATTRWASHRTDLFSWSYALPGFELVSEKDEVVVLVRVKKWNPGASAQVEMVDPPAWLSLAEPEKTMIREVNSEKDIAFIPVKIKRGKDSNGKCVNQLFRVRYQFPYKNREGQERTSKQVIDLPVLRIQG